jgi:hypothetical protein|tara:strand:+ start:176 stop:370 length:195 start_codon:yes stop_codon:yes gene_type:complete
MNHYNVYVKETVTKVYSVEAESEDTAKEIYLTEGITSPLSNTAKDREVIIALLSPTDSIYPPKE